MIAWPDLGTRVSVRYRRPAGSVPPLTDAVGQLLSLDPSVRVRTKSGAIVEFDAADVTALRVLTDAPVRTSQIRALEYAAALAWPGAEREWLAGWLLRAEQGSALSSNSAVPLDISAQHDALPAIADWYRQRGLAPLLAIPDRLMPVPAGFESAGVELVLVRELGEAPDAGDVELDDESHASVTLGDAVARAAVSDAPDGTRWVGLSARGPADGFADAWAALLAWGAGRGATRGYLVVAELVAGLVAEPADEDNGAATAVGKLLGFRPHHRRRYVRPSIMSSHA